MSLDGTFIGLKATLTDFLHRSDLSTPAGDLVLLGEIWLMRKVRATEMETALSVMISNGVATPPTGFLGLKHAYIDGTPTQPLRTMSAGQLLNRYPVRASSSKPCAIAFDAGALIFGPFPDSGYTVKGTYYKRQGPLSSGVYDLFTNHQDLFLMACLCEAEPYIKNDKRMPMWKAKREELLMDVNTQSQGISYSGGMAVTLA
jgi:hypothetical protein